MASLDKATNTAAPVFGPKTFRNRQRYRPGPIEGLPIREIHRAQEAQFRGAHKAFKLRMNTWRNNSVTTPSPDFLEINFPETWSMMERIESSINKPIGYHIRYDMFRKEDKELMKSIVDKELDNFVHRMNNKE